jgi:hypothetical protein
MAEIIPIPIKKPEPDSRMLVQLTVEEWREIVRKEIRAALNGKGHCHSGSPSLENDPLRNIANLDVDAIVGFRVSQGVVCWNCIRSADEPRRFDVVYGAEGVTCARCKAGLL